MQIQIDEEPATFLAEYARIPISFQVTRILDVASSDNTGDEFILEERVADAAYLKDYDATEEPLSWADRFDLSEWGIFSARVDRRVVAGAIVAVRSPDLAMLERRTDLALLWDIRVAPEVRRKGVGSALLRAAEKWASAHGATAMKVETQNINLPACRFYESHGFVLGAANERAYPDFPGETQLLWYKDLRAR